MSQALGAPRPLADMDWGRYTVQKELRAHNHKGIAVEALYAPETIIDQ